MSAEKSPAKQRAGVNLPHSKGPQSLPHWQSYHGHRANPSIARYGVDILILLLSINAELRQLELVVEF